MRVPKKEKVFRGREKEENVWKGSSSLGVFATRNLGHATRISGTRGEFRARGANLGRFRCSSDRQIRYVYMFRRISAHLGTQGATRHISARKAHLSAHLGVLDRQGVRDASDRSAWGAPSHVSDAGTALVHAQRSL